MRIKRWDVAVTTPLFLSLCRARVLPVQVIAFQSNEFRKNLIMTSGRHILMIKSYLRNHFCAYLAHDILVHHRANEVTYHLELLLGGTAALSHWLRLHISKDEVYLEKPLVEVNWLVCICSENEVAQKVRPLSAMWTARTTLNLWIIFLSFLMAWMKTFNK